MIFAGPLLLLIVVLAFFLIRSRDDFGSGRLRLPVGSGTPAISLGERHGLILASNGSLWSWGSDFLGWPVLGLGTITKSMQLRRIGAETNWTSISANDAHNLAIKTDGTLWTWGRTVEPQLVGLKTIPSPIPAAPGNDWKQAAAGGIHSVAIKKDGTLWAWGNNWAGSVGIENPRGSSAPVQVGMGTNWTKVWASLLETVALQNDGSLWYWGQNPDPVSAQGVGQIKSPTRVGSDTNWIDVGFGESTVFAIKSDGTLWAWGRQTFVYTSGVHSYDPLTPIQVGTNSNWKSFSSTAAWWCTGLTARDGSLWLLDASDGEPNGPRAPFKPIKFRQFQFEKPVAAYAGGATHAAGAGIHGPIGVVLTPDGEVWTWGMILGDPPTIRYKTTALAAKVGAIFHLKVPLPDPDPSYRQQPWQLRNIPESP